MNKILLKCVHIALIIAMVFWSMGPGLGVWVNSAYAAAEGVDTTALVLKLSEARSKLLSAVEGTAPGQYDVGSKNTLQNALPPYDDIVSNTISSQIDVDNAVNTLTILVSAFDAAVVPESSPLTYNGNISGFVGASGLDVSGSTTGDFNTTIVGVLTEYSNPGQGVSFSGTILGDIIGNVTGGVNYNGHDTLSAEITNSGASGHVYLIGSFEGADGNFVGKFVTQENPINFTSEITISGGDSVQVGNTLQLSAITNGASQDVVWAVYVNDLDKATINQTTGELTALGVGTITVIASALDGSLVTKNHNVTITEGASGPVATVVGFTANNQDMCVNQGACVLSTDNNPATNYELQFKTGSNTDEPLASGKFGLYLTNKTGVTTEQLTTYYNNRVGLPENYKSYLISALDGQTKPFAYVTGGAENILVLHDAAQTDLPGGNPALGMVIPGDYPVGAYTVSGQITDILGNPTTVTFTLVVPDQSTGGGGGGDVVAPIFDTISAGLTSAGIINNLNELTQDNYTGFSGAYFEKAGKGRITFNSSLDFSDSATQTYLTNLGQKLDMAQGGKIGLDVLGSALAGKSATVKFYETNVLGIPDTATAQEVYGYLVVKDSTGAVIDKSTLVSNPQFVGACGVGETICHYFAFDTGHFTTFELEVPVFSVALYVDDSNLSGVEDGTIEHPYNTIQEAVDEIDEGGTISVFPGIYSEGNPSRDIYTGASGGPASGLLVYKNGLIIQGVDSQGNPITDSLGVLATVKATQRDASLGDTIITGDNITISGLRFELANLPVGGNKNVFATGENFTLKNSVIDNLVLGYSGLYLSDERSGHVTAFNIQDNQFIKGELSVINGVGLSGDIANRKITGNKFEHITDWAGISLTGITGSGWTTQGIGDVTITGNTFTDNAYQIMARGGEYANPSGYWAGFLANNTFDKAVVALTPDGDARTSSYEQLGWVNDLTDPSKNDFFRVIGTDIQEGVDRATAGDTVRISAGTYDEQVVIDGKDLTLQGAGDTTIIQPTNPEKLTELYTYPTGVFPSWVGVKMASIVVVKNTNTTVLKDFKVDGVNVSSLPVGSGRLSGVLYGESSGIIDNVTINTIKTTNYVARSYGIDLSAVTGNHNVEVKNSHITDWARNGIQAMGEKLTANIHDNVLVGPGIIGPDNVPNGIVFIYKVGGNAKANTINNNGYNAGTWKSMGIMVWGPVATGIILENNSIFNIDDAIGLTANASDVIVRGNNLHNNLKGIQIEAGAFNNSITDNTIIDNTYGIFLSDDSNAGAGNTASNNIISGNITLAVNNLSTNSFNAENNWWGSASGPRHSSNTSGTGDVVTDRVTFKPWYTNVGMTTLSDIKSITAFTIPNQIGETTIDGDAHTINLAMPYGVDVTQLAPTILFDGDRVNPTSGAVNNFTIPQTYTVTAIDGTSLGYSVNVSIAPDTTNPEINHTGFTADGTNDLAYFDGGYVLNTTNNSAVNHTVQFKTGSVASENLKAEVFGLFLQPTTGQTAELITFYSSKPEAYKTYLNAAASGTQPFAFIKGNGDTSVQILDGAQYTLASNEVDMVIPDNYPLGSYRVTGQVKDLAGNLGDVEFVLVVTGDREAPTGTITINGGAEYTTSRDVVLTIDDQGSGAVEMNIANHNSYQDWESYSTTKNWTLTEGDAQKTLRVKFKDAAGNVTATGIADTITLDTAKPSVVSVSLDGQSFNSSSLSPVGVMVTFSEDVVNTPVIEVHTNLFVQSVNDCEDSDAKTFCFQYWINTDEEVTHTIWISGAQDIAGNEMDPDTTRVFNVDTFAPVITIGPYDTNPTNQNVYVTASTNEGTLNATSHTFTSNGSFDFVATDGAGNTTTRTVTINNIDKDSPVITFGPYDGVTLTNQSITITASTNEGTLNEYSHTFDLNGDFTFIATDDAGNTTTETIIITNIDKNAPTSSIVNIAENSYLRGLVTVEASASDDDSGVAKVEFWYESIGTKIGEDTSVPYSIVWNTAQEGAFGESIVSDGNHTIFVRAYDNTGNYTDSTGIQVKVDNTAPTGQISYSTTSKTTDDVIATLNPNEEVTVTYPATGLFTHTFDANDSFEFQFVDRAGNTGSAEAIVNWIDRSSVAPNPFTVGSESVNSLTLNWTNTESNGSYYVLKYATSTITEENFSGAKPLSSLPSLTNGNQAYVVKNLVPDTHYYFGLRVVDELGNVSTTAFADSTTLAETQIPTDITAPASITDLDNIGRGVIQTTQIGIGWTAVGDDGSEGIASRYVIKRSSALIDANNFDSAVTVFNSMVPQMSGVIEQFILSNLVPNTQYCFAVKVFDDNNNSSLSNSFCVTTENNLPIITEITPTTGVNDSAVQARVFGTNFDGSGNTLRFTNSLNTFDLTVLEVEGSWHVRVPVGTPVGVYSLRLINANGTSELLPNAYTITTPEIPPPSVTDVVPGTIGTNDSNISVEIYGKNFTGATGADVDVSTTLDLPDVALTNFIVVSDTKITGTILGLLSAGSYYIKVTTPVGTNTISAVKLTVEAPVVVDDTSSQDVITNQPIDMGNTNETPVQITLQSDSDETTLDNNTTVEVVIPPATEITDTDGNAYTGNINPPQVVKPTEEITEVAGENSLVITMGNPEEKINFSNDLVVTIRLESQNSTAPLIWYYNPSTGLEIAGKDGTKDGVTYTKGGTVLNTEIIGTTYYFTIGLLLDHMSSYVAGVTPTISSTNPTSATAGSSVTITGTNFGPGATVKFGDTSATATVNSTTQITATVPSISSGSYTLKVTNTDALFASTSFTINTTPVSTGNSGGSGGGPVGLMGVVNYAPQIINTPVITNVAPVIGQVLGVSTFAFNTNLRVGMTGNDVRELQIRLTEEGVYIGPITGYFGQLTLKAVKAYQALKGLPQTGFMGPMTQASLNNSQSGQVLGVSTTAEVERQALIKSIRLKILDLMRQLEELKAQPGVL